MYQALVAESEFWRDVLASLLHSGQIIEAKATDFLSLINPFCDEEASLKASCISPNRVLVEVPGKVELCLFSATIWWTEIFTRKPSCQVATTSLAQRPQQTTKNTSRRNASTKCHQVTCNHSHRGTLFNLWQWTRTYDLDLRLSGGESPTRQRAGSKKI